MELKDGLSLEYEPDRLGLILLPTLILELVL